MTEKDQKEWEWEEYSYNTGVVSTTIRVLVVFALIHWAYTGFGGRIIFCLIVLDVLQYLSVAVYYYLRGIEKIKRNDWWLFPAEMCFCLKIILTIGMLGGILL